MRCCPTCRGTGSVPDHCAGDPFERQVQAAMMAQAREAVGPVDALLAVCRQRSIPVTWDNHVDAAGAAALIGRQPKTLRSWRQAGTGPVYRKISGRAEYALDLLAEFSRAK